MAKLSKFKITTEGRECTKCLLFKEWGEFADHPGGPNGKNPRCRVCLNEQRKQYPSKSGKRISPLSEQSLDQNRRNAQAHHYERREMVFEHYGSRCSECGEEDREQLQLDHIDESGRQHREEDPGARNLTWWVVKNGFPEGFQILCRLCNMRKSWAVTRDTRMVGLRGAVNPV